MRLMCENFLEQSRGRILGIDVGCKTIGVSVSDERQIIASSLHTIKRTSLKADILSLKNTVYEFKSVAIVFGWPIETCGSEGSQCKIVDELVTNLEAEIDIPLIQWDERFSTCTTESILLEADLSRSKRKKVIDKMAAAYILQGALDYLSNLRRSNA